MTPEDAYSKLIANDDFVLDALDRRARTSPEKLYVYYGEDDISLTYGEFKALTDRIAAGLSNQGLRAGSPVSVLTKNSLLSVLSMYAIWRAGGIYAPINFNFTEKLIAYQLNDTKPSVIITDDEFYPVIQKITKDSPDIRIAVHHPALRDHDYKGIEKCSDKRNDLKVINFDSLKTYAGRRASVTRSVFDDANIVYTSGTTGRSKGVVQAFRWMSYYAQLQYVGYTSDDVIYCDLPMYHVAGAFALATRAMWAGCSIGIWDKFSPRKFWQRINKIGASNAILLDVMINWLMASPPRKTDRINTLNKVHMQPLPENHNEVAKRFGFDIITCGYGQTESGSAFFGAIDELDISCGTPPGLWKGMPKGGYMDAVANAGGAIKRGCDRLPRGFMGRPNPLLEVAVLDSDDNHCSLGAIGQLCYRPVYPGLLLKGYLNNSVATATVLRNCWYHTGDAGYESKEEPGMYVFVDRMGGFFRVHGENVSSFEVEALLNAHPAVRTCAAVAVRATEGNEDDIAMFVVLNEGYAIQQEELDKFIAVEFPKHMRPKYLRIVDRLPTTPTNKVEKYKLKEMLLKELKLG